MVAVLGPVACDHLVPEIDFYFLVQDSVSRRLTFHYLSVEESLPPRRGHMALSASEFRDISPTFVLLSFLCSSC